MSVFPIKKYLCWCHANISVEYVTSHLSHRYILCKNPGV
jgi:hypothetical protein